MKKLKKVSTVARIFEKAEEKRNKKSSSEVKFTSFRMGKSCKKDDDDREKKLSISLRAFDTQDRNGRRTREKGRTIVS